MNGNSNKPISKTNTILKYINISSNHPISIIKQIPNMIDIRMNILSSSKNISNNHIEFYDETIHNSGCKNELKYLETKRPHNNRDNNLENHRTNNNMNMNNWINKDIKKRPRNIIWFNPLFCKLSDINIGKCFFKFNKQAF